MTGSQNSEINIIPNLKKISVTVLYNANIYEKPIITYLQARRTTQTPDYYNGPLRAYSVIAKRTSIFSEPTENG